MSAPIPLLPDSDADSLNLSQDTVRVAESATPRGTDPRFVDLDLYAETKDLDFTPLDLDFTPLDGRRDSGSESPEATDPEPELKLDRVTKQKTRSLINSIDQKDGVFKQLRLLADHVKNENHDADALRRYVLQKTKTRVTDEEHDELEMLLTHFFP